MSKLYDVIILGAGPGGLAAGLYSGRARLSTLIIEKGSDGGQIAITDEIENYPGQVLENESGPTLIARMTKQCEHFGCERVSDTVVSVELKGDVKKVTCNNGTYEGKTVIIATGAYPRPIGCEGEKEFASKGVSYCATCDANFFEGFDVYVVGGGDSAVEEAMYLQNLQEMLPLFIEEMSLELLSLFRRKLSKLKIFTLCGTVPLQNFMVMASFQKWMLRM